MKNNNIQCCGSVVTPSNSELRIFELENDDSLLVLATDVTRAYGYSKKSSPTLTKKAPTIFYQALQRLNIKLIPVQRIPKQKNQYMWAIDLNLLPWLTETFIEMLLDAPRSYKKHDLLFDNSCNFLDWLDTEIMPAFYEISLVVGNEKQPAKTSFDNKAYMREWHKNNPEYQRQWRANNREHVREYNRRWREANPEYARQWYLANRDHALSLQRKYDARRRAAKKAVQTSLFPAATP